MPATSYDTIELKEQGFKMRWMTRRAPNIWQALHDGNVEPFGVDPVFVTTSSIYDRQTQGLMCCRSEASALAAEGVAAVGNASTVEAVSGPACQTLPATSSNASRSLVS